MKILGSLIHYNLSGIFLLLVCKSNNFSKETCLIICFINVERKMMRYLLYKLHIHIKTESWCQNWIKKFYFIFLFQENRTIRSFKSILWVVCALWMTLLLNKIVGFVQWNRIIQYEGIFFFKTILKIYFSKVHITLLSKPIDYWACAFLVEKTENIIYFEISCNRFGVDREAFFWVLA